LEIKEENLPSFLSSSVKNKIPRMINAMSANKMAELDNLEELINHVAIKAMRV
jgi:hypothetical protein